jgi:hypothetical protein
MRLSKYFSVGRAHNNGVQRLWKMSPLVFALLVVALVAAPEGFQMSRRKQIVRQSPADTGYEDGSLNNSNRSNRTRGSIADFVRISSLSESVSPFQDVSCNTLFRAPSPS